MVDNMIFYFVVIWFLVIDTCFTVRCRMRGLLCLVKVLSSIPTYLLVVFPSSRNALESDDRKVW